MLSEAVVLFDHLLARTAREEPVIREFFQRSGLEDLTERILINDVHHVGTGGYADVFEAGLLGPPSHREPKKVEFQFHSMKGKNEAIPSKVAVKVLRINKEQLDAEDRGKLSRI